jgi:Zn-dependent protease
MSELLDLSPVVPPVQCRRCATELPPHALSCPVCATLVHREKLEDLATAVGVAAAGADRVTERALWEQARPLVPADSQQYTALTEKIRAASVEDVAPAEQKPGGKRGWTLTGAAAGIGLLLLGKLKFLLLGLTKLSTVLSMFGFIGVYWSIYGWPLAVGIAGSIYIHEMGHVAMLRRLGIAAGAPLFIPGVGALIMLRERVVDPLADARIGLAGPTWGLVAGIGAWVVYQATGLKIWHAIAELVGFMNLFNLIPIWQLDGAHGFRVLNATQRWLIVAACTLCVGLTGVGMLWLIAAVGAYQAYRGEPGPGDNATLVTFAGLIAALSWLAHTIS